MELKEWLKIYEEILRDFNFSRARDEEAARLISELGHGKLLDCKVLECIKDQEVAVIGGAYKGEKIRQEFVITAGKAIEKVDIIPRIHVTDLEEGLDKILKLEKEGCILVFHAHGDNMHRLREIVPKVEKFVATTQCEPFDRVYNFGGFTDGDRAVLLAKRFGAKKIVLYGFDFEKGEGLKLKKLKWARKILEIEGVLDASSKDSTKGL
ncbi:MAG: 6-hydroxymethylpterin diphosphokinase MptE-like protein [Archaeoglobaceae archaeon]